MSCHDWTIKKGVVCIFPPFGRKSHRPKACDPKEQVPPKAENRLSDFCFRSRESKTKKIFVGGVSQETATEEVREYFRQFGESSPA